MTQSSSGPVTASFFSTPSDPHGFGFANQTAIGWTGKFHDSLGETTSLQFNGHRVYNASLATWIP